MRIINRRTKNKTVTGLCLFQNFIDAIIVKCTLSVSLSIPSSLNTFAISCKAVAVQPFGFELPFTIKTFIVIPSFLLFISFTAYFCSTSCHIYFVKNGQVMRQVRLHKKSGLHHCH